MSPEQLLSKLGVSNVHTVSVDNTVEEAIHFLNEKEIRAAPVVDNDGVFRGMFSEHEILKNLVPSYIDGLQTLDFATGASTVLAARMKRMFPSRVGDHVSCEDCVKIDHTSPTWEALRVLTRHGSPLPIVDPKTGKLKGLISDQSAVKALLAMDTEDEADGQD